MVYKFYDKKSAFLADKSTKSSSVAILQNDQLAKVKPIITKF